MPQDDSGFVYDVGEQLARTKDMHFDGDLLKAIVEAYAPRSLIDLGCGVGWYCEAARALGVRCVIGYEKTPGTDRIAVYPIRQADLATEQVRAGPMSIALCLEVGQYISADKAAALVDNCCGNAPRVVFSAAQPGQPGFGMVNQQARRFWIAMFRDREFVLNEVATARLARAARLYWLKTNLCVFEGRGART